MKLSGTPSKAGTYSFVVSATGCGGGVAKASYKVAIQPKADHVVDLSWNASSSTDVAGYDIYRGPDGKSWARVNVSLTASSTYADLTVADSSTYYYAATAVDICGHESRESNIAKSIIPDCALMWAVVEEVRMALCRCSQSRNKPFCDNGHFAARFDDPGAVPPSGRAG